MHLFISLARLSSMVVNFFNQNPRMPSWPGVFQFYIFLRVVLSSSGRVFTWGPSLSIRNSVSMFFKLIQRFYYNFSVPIFCSQIILHPVVNIASPILSLIVGRTLFCLVYIVWSSFSLPFFASIFWLISTSFFLVLVAVLFQFRLNISRCSVSVFLLVAVVFLSVISFSHQR